MTQTAGLATSLALAGAVFAGAVSPSSAQGKPQLSPTAQALLNADLDKMRARNAEKIAGQLDTAFSWACKDGKPSGYVNKATIIAAETAGKIKLAQMSVAKQFLSGPLPEDQFIKDNLSYSFSALSLFEESLHAQVKANGPLADAIKKQIDAFQAAPGLFGTNARANAVLELADLACKNEPLLRSFVGKISTNVDFPKIAAEVEAARTKFKLDALEPQLP